MQSSVDSMEVWRVLIVWLQHVAARMWMVSDLRLHVSQRLHERAKGVYRARFRFDGSKIYLMIFFFGYYFDLELLKEITIFGTVDM